MSKEKQNRTHRQRRSASTDKYMAEKPVLDDVWPVHSAGGWPQDVSLDRGDIYEGRT